MPIHPYTPLLLRRFLLDYSKILMEFQHALAPSNPHEAPDPRYVESCKQLPYVCFLLEYLAEHPMEAAEAAALYDLTRELAKFLDSYHSSEMRNAA